WLQGRPGLSLRKPLLASITAGALLVLLASSFDIHELVSDRLESERVTWESLRQAASHEEHDLSSIEVRIASWSAAIDWIMEKPFMGWGGRGSRPLIRNSEDRKSTRLNSSHVKISYAVFCLKKKTIWRRSRKQRIISIKV